MRYKSPLRYPGGKGKLAGFVKELLRANRLLDGVYAEPYAGGASLALALLFEECASEICINDLDPAVHAFWYAVLNETDALCRLIRRTIPTPTVWEKQRGVYEAGLGDSYLALGFALFFLNRTNRSGIIASGGMIGGRQQRGHWKIDARYNGPELAERVARIARYRDRIHLSNHDAEKFLRKFARTAPRRSLVYLDPPYFVKGQRRLYANYYAPDDHARIAEQLRTFSRPWIVSYDDVPEIRRLYRGFKRFSYSLQYTAASREQGHEAMFVSPRLVVPIGVQPALDLQSAHRHPQRTRASER